MKSCDQQVYYNAWDCYKGVSVKSSSLIVGFNVGLTFYTYHMMQIHWIHHRSSKNPHVCEQTKRSSILSIPPHSTQTYHHIQGMLFQASHSQVAQPFRKVRCTCACNGARLLAHVFILFVPNHICRCV